MGFGEGGSLYVYRELRKFYSVEERGGGGFREMGNLQPCIFIRVFIYSEGLPLRGIYPRLHRGPPYVRRGLPKVKVFPSLPPNPSGSPFFACIQYNLALRRRQYGGTQSYGNVPTSLHNPPRLHFNMSDDVLEQVCLPHYFTVPPPLICSSHIPP